MPRNAFFSRNGMYLFTYHAVFFQHCSKGGGSQTHVKNTWSDITSSLDITKMVTKKFRNPGPLPPYFEKFPKFYHFFGGLPKNLEKKARHQQIVQL